MIFNYGTRTIHVKANPESQNNSCNSILISRQQFANTPTNAKLFAVCTTTLLEGNFEPLLSEAKDLMKEYKDVFPTSLPKELPSKCVIDYSIDLVPGSEPP